MSHDTQNTKQNKEIVERLFAAFGANDHDAMGELLASDFVAHGLSPDFGAGAAGFKNSATMLHAALHDCRYEIQDLIAEGDRVAARYMTWAVHAGELFGATPTGRSVTMSGIEIYRLAGGKVVEYWGEANMSDLFADAGRPVS